MLVFYAKEGPPAGKKIARHRVRSIQPNPALNAALDRLANTASVDANKVVTEIITQLKG